jgi:hypothetical protein
MAGQNRIAMRDNVVPLYHTTLFTHEPPGGHFRSRGSAWTFEKASGIFTGTKDELADLQERLRNEVGHAPAMAYFGNDEPIIVDMEIMIRARDLAAAERAFNQLIAAMAVVESGITFCPEPFTIELRQEGAPRGVPSYRSISGLIGACLLANKASRKRRMSYALHKLHLSYRSISPDIRDLDPSSYPRRFRVHKDQIFHVYLGNAITLAYSAIEEMGLEIRATDKNPMRMPDGNWNPSIKLDLESRLLAAGIDLNEPPIWTLRGPKTRIERKGRPVGTSKPSWSWGPIVRDIYMPVIDALAMARWLRSRTSAHRFTDTARSLTAYDAHSVQSLARRLLMESLGFWRRV